MAGCLGETSPPDLGEDLSGPAAVQFATPSPPTTRPDLDGWSFEAAEFVVEADVEGDLELFLVRGRDDTAWVRLTESPGHDARARWAPDGSWIVFESDRASEGYPARRHLFRLDLPRGGAPSREDAIPPGTPLVVSGGFGEGASVSPDGARIAFRSTRSAGRREGVGHLWTLAIGDSTGDAVRVTREPVPYGTLPAWHPSGRDLFYARQRVGGGPAPILLVSLDGIRERSVVSDGRVHDTPLPSPDGSRIAWTTRAIDSDTVEVRIADLDGGNARELVRGRYRLTDWTPDGAHLVADLLGGELGQPVLIPVKGGAVEPLLRSAAPASGAAFRPPPRIPTRGG
jgi:Tol biopolymer transport system component